MTQSQTPIAVTNLGLGYDGHSRTLWSIRLKVGGNTFVLRHSPREDGLSIYYADGESFPVGPAEAYGRTLREVLQAFSQFLAQPPIAIVLSAVTMLAHVQSVYDDQVRQDVRLRSDDS